VTRSPKKPRRRPVRIPIALADDERRSLDEVARDHCRVVLEACRGNQTNAARVLGIDRKTLARSLRTWGVPNTTVRLDLRPGALIAIEGIDGSGISTQAARLVAELNERGHRALLTGEPSHGRIGELVRELLATRSDLSRAATLRTLSLLFAADRIDHFQRVVAPALAGKTTVVSDRWYHSSLAYQRTGVERDWIVELNRHTRIPDITILLDVSTDVGQQRRAAAGRPPEFFHDAATQSDVVAGYRATISELRARGERIEVIDGEQSEDAVFTSVLHALGLGRSRQR
jgi:dTMP kinase